MAIVARLVVACVALWFAPGCDEVFGLEEVEIDPRIRPIPHLPPAGHRVGTGMLSLGDAVINTTGVTISTGEALDVELFPQQDGLSLMVVYAERVEIFGLVRVQGGPALVIVADEITVTSTGILDASADLAMAGPGGYMGSVGNGTGGPGLRGVVDNDSGGGGGGFAEGAADGGAVAGGCSTEIAVAGGAAGAAYGVPTLDTLEGGGSGGRGARGACGSPTPGGGGGGAVQLSAYTSITIDGAIGVGGGGGVGGPRCSSDAAAGGGGGAGGAIYLDARVLVIAGVLAANGGGGGGAGSSIGTAGAPGQDGSPSLLPAGGGARGSASVGEGGAGAAGNVAATPGENQPCDSNGGGGGGAVGRIAVRGTPTFTGISSPMFELLPFTQSSVMP